MHLDGRRGDPASTSWPGGVPSASARPGDCPASSAFRPLSAPSPNLGVPPARGWQWGHWRVHPGLCEHRATAAGRECLSMCGSQGRQHAPADRMTSSGDGRLPWTGRLLTASDCSAPSQCRLPVLSQCRLAVPCAAGICTKIGNQCACSGTCSSITGCCDQAASAHQPACQASDAGRLTTGQCWQRTEATERCAPRGWRRTCVGSMPSVPKR